MGIERLPSFIELDGCEFSITFVQKLSNVYEQSMLGPIVIGKDNAVENC